MNPTERQQLQTFFATEAYDLLKEALQKLAASESSSAEHYLEVLDWLARQMHQFRQDSSLMGYFDLSNLAYQLEGEARRINETKAVFKAEDIHRFEVYLENLHLFLDFYNQNSDEQQDSLYKVRKNFQISQEVMDLYLVEVRDHVELFQRTLMDVERGKLQAQSALEEIYRAVHSIKGDSNALGFFKIAELSHNLENQISELQQVPALSEVQMNDLFEWGEQLKQVVEHEISEKVASQALDPVSFSPPPPSDVQGKSELDIIPPDAEMDELYQAEALEILQGVAQSLDQLAQKKAPRQTLLDNIYRAVHTLKGNSNALGFEQIGEAAGQLEAVLARYKTHADTFSLDDLQSLRGQFDVLRQALPAPTAQQQAEELSSVPAKVSHSDEVTDDLDEITLLYVQEAEDISQSISQTLLALEAGSATPKEGIESVYRAVHTLKGNSNALGFEAVGQAAHVMESELSQLRKTPKKLNKSTLQALFDHFEHVQLTLQSLKTPQPAVAEPSLPTPTLPVQTDVTLDEDTDEITQLYLEEAQEILITLSQLLQNLSSGQLTPQTGIESVYRAVHTLKGNSNALGFEGVGQIAHEMELELSRLRKSPEQWDSLTLELISSHFAHLQQALQTLQTPQTQVVVSSDELEPDSDTVELDEITQLYTDEAQEMMGLISQQLLALEAGELKPKEGIESIYRAVHTLKGNSNALGFELLGQLAHEAESVLQKLRKTNKRPNPEHLERLFKFHREMEDGIQAILSEASQKAKKEIQRQTQHRKKSITQELRLSQPGRPVQTNILRVSQELHTSGTQWRKDKGLLSTGSGKKRLELSSGEMPKKRQQKDDETIRVSVNKIDQLINLSDELLIHKISYEQKINHLEDMQALLSGFRHQVRNDDALAHHQHGLLNSLQTLTERLNVFEKELKEDINGFALTVDEIQYHSRKTRMLPCTVLVDPLRLVVRSTAQKLDKQVDFLVLGEDTEIDRLMVEKLKDPLGHLIRNAIDHGLETTAERQESQKPARAQLLVEILLSGNQIIFQIQDDGRGINYEKIRQKAIKAGLYTEEQIQHISDAELNRLIFTPGFSTAEKVSDISGRGVGLDVVRTTIENLNGQIEVMSEMGQGTRFRISLPVTLTTFDAFLIHLGQRRFAVPRALILSTQLLEQTQLRQHQNQWVMDWNGQPVPVQALHSFLGMEPYTPHPESRILLMYMNQTYLGLLVDEVLEARELVMKPLGEQLKKVRHISGATILGEGEPVLVLDLHDVFYDYYQEQYLAESAVAKASDQPTQRQTRVLVVDDSVTTRTLEKNILVTAGFDVDIATNGKEAQQKLPAFKPDIIITDCEMPIMDGYAFTSWVKKESEFGHIPMIMVTSLAEEEFKQRAFQAGVDDFIVKGQFKQAIFLDKIQKLIKHVTS